MNERIKLAGIAAATVLTAVGLFSYCSPYQTCVRARTAQLIADDTAHRARAAETAEERNAEIAKYIPDFEGAPAAPMTEDEAERASQLYCAEVGA